MKDTDTVIVTDDEWRELATKVDSDPEMLDGKTRRELVKIWGTKRSATIERLAKLRKLGLIEVGCKWVAGLSGRKQKVPAYRILKEKK